MKTDGRADPALGGVTKTGVAASRARASIAAQTPQQQGKFFSSGVRTSTLLRYTFQLWRLLARHFSLPPHKIGDVGQMLKESRVVLVADDNSANRYIACRMLRQANYSTIEAMGGKEAVELARQFRPDMIVLDVNMPDQSGFMTLQQLRDHPRTASIPVVFLSAIAHSAFDRNRAEQLGASAYLFSPVDPVTLVAVVEGSIARARPLAKPAAMASVVCALDDHRRRALSEPNACRPWRIVAEELGAEANPERLTELSIELTRALDEQELRAKSKPHIREQDPYPATASQRSDYEKIVEDAVALMRSDYASLQMLFPERGSGGELLLLSFRGFNPEAAKFWEWVRADSKSTCGIALRDNERVVATDIAGCDFMAGSDDQEVCLQTGIHACQTTPLIGRGGNVVGMVSTHWRRPHKPSEKDFELFDTLAKQAVDVIERCRR